MTKKVFEREFFNRQLRIEIDEMAKQANGSVLVRYDDTVVLSTACASNEAKMDIDFFPLTVAYEEKQYSVGKIPGGFLRREGKAGEHGTLTARMIDRPIRPLFAEGFRNEVQIINTVLSVDPDATPEMSAMFGSSLALGISDIPFNGPIAGVYVGKINDEYIINPTPEQKEKSTIDLAVAGTKYAINMVEAGAKEVSEEEMLEALYVGHDAIKKLVAFQEEIISEVGKEKREVELYHVDESIDREVRDKYETLIRKAVSIEKKQDRYDKIDEYRQQAITDFESKTYDNSEELNRAIKQVKEIVHEIEADEVRRLIVEDKIRPDGRKINELRPLDSQVDLLPRVHGSAMFTRGETQVLSVTTLGPLNDEQIIDDLTDVTCKKFMHHYNFPPFSVGETGRLGAPGRREIGHGALGERALKQVLPSTEEFPYTIRTVAEVLESNGSSSQASICAGTMSLMAAGVPIKAPVAGVAMGLIMNEETKEYTVLTDIQGLEDHFGDMDFKVAGTSKGITALQMDIKVSGITRNIFEEALSQAHQARLEILDNMATAIDRPRAEVSKYAPKTATFMIAVDKIKDVIGKGGDMINKIIEACDDIKIDIEDDGQVILYHSDQEMIDKAKAMILEIVREAKVGEIYDAKVVRIEKFGAFVNLFKGCDALLHISKISDKKVEKVEDVLKIGDVIRVKVTNVDNKGRVDVSAKNIEE